LPLIGRCTRDARRLEPPHAGDGIKDSAALETRIDHDANALDGETGLGDVRGQHHLARTGRGGCQRGILLLRPQLTVQRQHPRTLRQRAAL
jgi:hypothetical protein